MTSNPDDPFNAAMAALLGPLAQAMVARGMTLGMASEALKKALLEAALTSSGDAISDSRASLLTGIHRKDIKRLRTADDGAQAAPRRTINTAAQVLSYWATAPDYQGPDGTPRDLVRRDRDGQPGFDALVKRTRADMAPGTVLQVLVDQGAVDHTQDGSLRLVSHLLVPDAGSAQQVAAYQATLSAHLVAATQNLLADPGGPRHFDRAVRYSHLSAASVETLRQLSADKAQTLLQEINAKARSLQEQEADGDHRGRFVLGAYILPSPDLSNNEEDPE